MEKVGERERKEGGEVGEEVVVGVESGERERGSSVRGVA